METTQGVTHAFLIVVKVVGEPVLKSVGCVFPHWINVVVDCDGNTLSVEDGSIQRVPGTYLHIEKFGVIDTREGQGFVHPLDFLSVDWVVE